MCAAHVVKNVPLLSLPWSATMFRQKAPDWPDPAVAAAAAASSSFSVDLDGDIVALLSS